MDEFDSFDGAAQGCNVTVMLSAAASFKMTDDKVDLNDPFWSKRFWHFHLLQSPLHCQSQSRECSFTIWTSLHLFESRHLARLASKTRPPTYTSNALNSKVKRVGKPTGSPIWNGNDKWLFLDNILFVHNPNYLLGLLMNVVIKETTTTTTTKYQKRQHIFHSVL